MTSTEALNALHTVASTRADHGGPSRSVPFLCEALARRGVSVRLVTALPAEESSAILPEEPVKTIAIGEEGWLSRTTRAPIAFYRALQQQVRDEPPDVMHDHGVWLPSNAAAALVARRHGIPLVISTRGMLTRWALKYNRWKKRLAWAAYQKYVLKQAALFHVTSQEEVVALRELGYNQPVALIPNGVKIPEHDRVESPTGQMHKALFLSRLHPKKGLPMLIEAWAEVRPEGWELVLVGPSEKGHRAELERQVQEHGLDEAITFVGAVPDEEKWSYYESADLFVLPTHSENFGIVVAEALASGLPVITTKGAPWEALEMQRCGWWTDIDTASLAQALHEAVALSDEERAAMGRHARAFIGEQYSWRKVAEKMQSVYAWVLGELEQPDFIHFA